MRISMRAVGKSLRPAVLRACPFAVLGALIATVVIQPAPARADRYLHCRPPQMSLPGDKLLVEHVGCRTARHVIAVFYEKAQSAGPEVRIHGFDCLAAAAPGNETTINCRRGRSGLVLRGPGGI